MDDMVYLQAAYMYNGTASISSDKCIYKNNVLHEPSWLSQPSTFPTMACGKESLR